MQVCEGLFRYNYSSEMEPIPCLASDDGLWNPSCTQFTVNLKKGVTFHDGSNFDAYDVKWAFDRLQYFTSGIWKNGSFYKYSHNLDTNDLFFVDNHPILNSTEVSGDYQVIFHLNFPYVPFKSLLANTACAIQLPDQNCNWGTNFFNLLDINDELIGTGPFKLTEYELDIQVVLDFYPDYHLPWNRQHIERIIYLVVPDPIALSLATLNHEVHWGYVVPTYYPQFTEDPMLIEIPIKKSRVYFIQMNTLKISFDIRRASQWCWNYAYFNSEIFNNSMYSLKVPIPDGMMYHLSGVLGEPNYDIHVAREYILNTKDPNLAINITSSGLNSTSSNDEWINIAESISPLAWYNFTFYNSSMIQLVAEQFKENLKSIGIRLDILEPENWEGYKRDYIQNLTGNQKMSYSMGFWEPAVYDPISMIKDLYQSNGSNNAVLLSDATFDTLINLSYNTREYDDRRAIFELMQRYFVNNLVPSFYIAQEGDSIYYNNYYVLENTIEDLLNPKGDHYWFNVGFYYSRETYLNLDMKIVYIFIGIVAGCVGLVILVTFLEKYISNKCFYSQGCGKRFRIRKNLRFCSFCGTKIPEKWRI